MPGPLGVIDWPDRSVKDLDLDLDPDQEDLVDSLDLHPEESFIQIGLHTGEYIVLHFSSLLDILLCCISGSVICDLHGGKNARCRQFKCWASHRNGLVFQIQITFWSLHYHSHNSCSSWNAWFCKEVCMVFASTGLSLNHATFVIENIQNLRLLRGVSWGSNSSNSVCSLTYPKVPTTANIQCLSQHF